VLFFPEHSMINVTELTDRKKIRAWLERLAEKLEIANPLAADAYASGLRPEYPERNTPGREESALKDWFINSLTLDIYHLGQADEPEFESYLDRLDFNSSRALLELGSIAARYNLHPAEYTESGLSIITDDAQRESFRKHFLDEAVLNSSFQVLAELYYRIHGKLYSIKT